MSYVVTDLVEADYQEYYNGFANRVLWPILHYRLDLAEFSRRDLSGYMRVNAHFADELADLLQPDDVDLGARLSPHSAGEDAARARPPQPHRILPACAVSAPRNRHRAAQPRLVDPALAAYDLWLADRQRRDQSGALSRATNAGYASRDEFVYEAADRTVRLGAFPIGIETASSTAWRGVRCARRWCAAWWRASPGAR